MFEGIYTAVVTPFDANVKVDFDSLIKILKYQSESEITGVVILGSTAEEKSLTLSEKIKIIKCAIKYVKNKEIIVGISCANLNEAIKTLKIYDKYQIHGYLLGTPYYVKPTQRGLFEYFSKIAAMTQKDICLYTVPSRTGCSILPKTVAKLSQIKNIIALKDATGDVDYAKNVLNTAKNGFKVLCGNDNLFLDYLKLGASGCISVVSNVFPNLLVNIQNNFVQNVEKSSRMFKKYSNFIDCLSLESNPIVIKYVLSKFKFCSSVMRLPLTEIENSNKILVDSNLKLLITEKK